MNLIFAVLAGTLAGLMLGIFVGRRFFADNKELGELRVKQAVLEAEKKKLEDMQAKQEEYFSALRNSAAAQFGELASKMLKEKSVELSVKNFEILNPLAENIEKFKTEIKNLEKETIDKNARLETQLNHMQTLNQNLAKEASNLTQALQSKKAQGNLGEIILEDVLQAGGLKEGVHYLKQEFLKDADGGKNYPDFIINLPDKRRVIVDSKMSLENYSKWINEMEESKKERHIKEHIEALRNHIKNLSGKEYQKLLKENGLDFAIMFIPVEYAYIAALDYDKNLAAFAAEKRVAVATASSLFPIIHIIEGLWRIDKTNKSMSEIVKNGEEMHKKVIAFLSEMEKLGSAMKSSQNTYEDAMIKLRGKGGILSRAAALEKLGIKTGKSVENETDDSAAMLPQDDNL
ncbi:MAG: DNA recombination protein RmuC [Elusimicrobiota bacterium]|jgi:DNA recombination protein RmuC|nr:DNA recombination protein RmuC [Elusimicrobiota bacterium]